MTAARAARPPLAHTMTTGTALFFTTLGRRASSSSSGTFLAPPACPAANSSAPHTSISTAFSRLISKTALAAVSPPKLAPRSAGTSSMEPEASARTNKYQLSTKNFTLFLGLANTAILE